MSHSPKKSLKYTIAGIYHPIDVHLVSRRFIHNKYKELTGNSKKRGELIHGLYNKEANKIWVCYELAKERRAHTLLHELVHQIEDETEDLNEEAKCDIVATYLLNLFQSQSFQDTLKKIQLNE